MLSPGKRLRYWTESSLLYLLYGLARVMPLRLVSLPGEGIGRLMFDLVRYKRPLAERNIALAFGPGLTRREISRIARRCFCFFGGLTFEILAMPRISLRRLAEHLILDNPEVVDAALARGRGAVLISGHIGHWELMAGGLSATGRPLSMYVGRQSNPAADRLLNGIRRAMGTETFSKGSGLRGILKALRGGRIVAMLSDQHHSRKQHYIRFFGEPVSSVPGPAGFVRHSGAALIFGHCVREGRHRYRARFEEIPYAVTDNEEQDLLNISQAIADALESQVRRYPEQYFWMHRRWRGIADSVRLSETNRAFLAAGEPPPEKAGHP